MFKVWITNIPRSILKGPKLPSYWQKCRGQFTLVVPCALNSSAILFWAYSSLSHRLKYWDPTRLRSSREKKSFVTEESTIRRLSRFTYGKVISPSMLKELSETLGLPFQVWHTSIVGNLRRIANVHNFPYCRSVNLQKCRYRPFPYPIVVYCKLICQHLLKLLPI